MRAVIWPARTIIEELETEGYITREGGISVMANRGRCW
jgi:hypothetical protein